MLYQNYILSPFSEVLSVRFAGHVIFYDILMNFILVYNEIYLVYNVIEKS